ncbi:MAG: hypothetical protein R3E53_01175 [Myxococcota bacterium]
MGGGSRASADPTPRRRGSRLGRYASGADGAFNERLQKEIAAIEPWQDGCSNYYRSPSGRVVTQWPHSMGAFRDALAAIPLEDYEFVGRG